MLHGSIFLQSYRYFFKSPLERVAEYARAITESCIRAVTYPGLADYQYQRPHPEAVEHVLRSLRSLTFVGGTKTTVPQRQE
jgi:hypothetical protein